MFCTIFAAGCSSDDDDSSVKLTIVNTDLEIEANGGVGTVEYLAIGTVTATVNVDWCQVTEVSGTKVTVSVDANTGYPGRSAQLLLTDGTTTQQVTILQEGAIWKYNKNATYLNLTDAGGDIPVDMSSNLPIEISIPANVSQWLSYEMTGNGFKFVVKENSTGHIRGAIIKVTTGVREVEYALLQYDEDDLLGEWTGAVQVVSSYFQLNTVAGFEENTQIVKNADGSGYQLQLVLNKILDTTLVLDAIYEDGALVVDIPQMQNLGIYDENKNVLYASMIAGDNDGLYIKAKVYLAPVLLEDGQIALAYATDTYWVLGFFKDRVPSNSNFTGYTVNFPVILMQPVE